MATLPTIDSGRVQVQQVGAARLPEIQMPMINPVGSQNAASGAQNLASALDRMANFAFGQAKEFRQQEALQFVAENPISDDQLKALAEGKPLDAYMGESNGNIFDAAVMKARSLEIAAHFKAEGRVQYAKILDEVQNGRMTAEQARIKMATINQGLTKSLAGVSPDASMQVRADLATFGSTIYKSALDGDAKKRKQQQVALLDASSDALIRGLEEAYSQGFFIDSKGNKRNVDDIATSYRQSILNDALVLSDATLQTTYSKKFDDAQRVAKIGAVLKHISTDEMAANPQITLRNIRSGNLGKMNDVMVNLRATDEKAVREIESGFMEYYGRFTLLKKQEEDDQKKKDQNETKDLLVEYYRPGTSTSRKKEVLDRVLELRQLSHSEIESMLDPSKKEGDQYAYAAIEWKIVRGDIKEFDDLKNESQKAGMNGKQFSQLTSKLATGTTPEKTAAYSLLRQASGVPDVASAFASKDDQHKLDKYRKTTNIFESKVNDFVAKNPMARIPYGDIARESLTQYQNTDGANQKKIKARKQIDKVVKDLATKKIIPNGLSIDEDTDIQALKSKYPKIKQDDLDYIIKRQKILREVSE